MRRNRPATVPASLRQMDPLIEKYHIARSIGLPIAFSQVKAAGGVPKLEKCDTPKCTECEFATEGEIFCKDCDVGRPHSVAEILVKFNGGMIQLNGLSEPMVTICACGSVWVGGWSFDARCSSCK